jgi:hypothetical protein
MDSQHILVSSSSVIDGAKDRSDRSSTTQMCSVRVSSSLGLTTLARCLRYTASEQILREET